jgi:hypothetical protein
MKPDYKAIPSTVDLGDALVAECEAPDPTNPSYDSPGKLRAAWRYLQETDTTQA